MSWIYVVYVEIYRFFDWFQYTSIMLLLHDTEKKLSLWGLHTIYIFLSFLNIKKMNTRWKMFLISKVFEIISAICWGKLWKSVKKTRYTNIIIFSTFMLLCKYYIQAQRMEAIVVERMKFMIQHIYIIIAQMKTSSRYLSYNVP